MDKQLTGQHILGIKSEKELILITLQKLKRLFSFLSSNTLFPSDFLLSLKDHTLRIQSFYFPENSPKLKKQPNLIAKYSKCHSIYIFKNLFKKKIINKPQRLKNNL